MRRGAPSSPSSSSDIAADGGDGPPNSITIHFPRQDYQRELVGPTYDQEGWFLLTPENDNGWNQWIICYNGQTDERYPDIMIADRFVWWWGKYIASRGQ